MNDLRIGVFLQPRADDIGRLRANVAAAEAAGFDHVAIKDHPYEPGLLDTLALIGVLLGGTERIHLMPGVANLPLRPPAMLAKAAATLNLLSGGRFGLGLGAGYRWEQISGFGGPRLLPGQAVTAVAEAIEILRAIWEPGRRVDHDGSHYRLRDAASGPAPADPIPIWLGAAGPRMLDLAGRMADGWISPMAMPYQTKPAAQDRIDAAARDSGRAPGAIRRVLQLVGAVAATDRGACLPTAGPGVQAVVASGPEWVQIIQQATAQRFDTVTIAPLNETAVQIRRFGEEVLPASRAALGQPARTPKVQRIR